MWFVTRMTDDLPRVPSPSTVEYGVYRQGTGEQEEINEQSKLYTGEQLVVQIQRAANSMYCS